MFYMDDLVICWFICELVFSMWSNYKICNVGMFFFFLSDEDILMWFNVLVIDGISEIERYFLFIIIKFVN